jgi:DNA repair protein RadC
MANTTTLERIIAEAKRIQKVHTHMSWKEAIKDASKHIKEGAKTVVKKAATKKATKTASKSGVGATYTMMTKDTAKGREIHGRINGSKIKLLAVIDSYGIIDYKAELPEIVKAEVRAMAKENLSLNGWTKGSTGFIENGEPAYKSTSHNFIGHRSKGNLGKKGTWTYFEQINGVKYKPQQEIIIGKISDKVKLNKVVPEVKVKINRGKKAKTDQVKNIKDAVEIIRRWITANKIETQEYFIVMYLDRALKVLGIYLNTIGTMNSVMIDRRLVYSAALQLGAQNMIVCHNHPSGTLSPSPADLDFTKDLVKGAKQIEIPVQDHIILTKDGYYSFAEHRQI